MPGESSRTTTEAKKTKNESFNQFLDPKEVKEPKYSPTENKYRLFLLKNLEQDRDVRESSHDEYDGKTYSQNYQENAKAGNSYIPPRKNKEDVNVVTGTTREKKLAIISSILNLVFETEFRAFNEDDQEDVEIGQAMTACVKQSARVERWDEKKIFAYSELTDQGDVFIEDLYVEETRLDKKKIPISEVDKDTFKDFDPKKAIKTVFAGCRRNILSGLQVYLGNIKQRDIRLQPRIFTKEVIPWEVAKSIYGHLPRWENVPRRMVNIQSTDEETASYGLNWRLGNLDADMVEVVKVQDKWNDEYQIFLNSVMQLPVGFPMPWEYGEYNITQGKLEPINSFFAYSKSTPAKSKFDQEVLDEMYRLSVLKTQKSFMPPIANYSGSILTKNMFLPGKVNNNLDKGDVEVLGGDPSMYGMRPAEFQMIQMIKKFIEEKSINPILQGETPEGDPTATEINTVTALARQNLGVMIFGFIQFHMNMDFLRLHLVLEEYPKQMGTKINAVTKQLENKFRTITDEQDIEGKGRGQLRVEFTETPLPSNELFDLEEGVQRDGNNKPIKVSPPKKPLRILQIKPSTLRSIKYHWYPHLVPKQQESSLAEKISFEDSLVKAAKLFGLQSINIDYAKEQWAVRNKLNPRQFFQLNQNDIPSLERMKELQSLEESNMTKKARGGAGEAANQGFGDS